ncbi:hypothetical protein MCAP1_000237 [Malassezia caprae]|uniref:Uncharacterized protein n=1 Tax=Malassezia caprae TaxID=1381934 RepID=A0AAF0IY99_9BASI|nr:hypothetical protein MCAP1_000237 [Malassezia caprae]
MSESPLIRIDAYSVGLLIVLAAFLLYARIIQHRDQPELHPLVLHKQSEVSSVHLAGESPTYRNVNAPLGRDLAMRPQRRTPTVETLLAHGLTGTESSHVRRVMDASLSNDEVRQQAATFMRGVETLVESDAPTIVVCGFLDTAPAVIAALAGAVANERARTVLVPPGVAPTRSPAGVDLAKTTVVCIGAPLLPVWADARLVVVRGTESLEGVQPRHSPIEWDDVLGAAPESTVPPLPDLSRTSSVELDRLGARVYATVWDGHSAWLDTTHTSMTAAVTAWLSEFPADEVPGVNDVVLTDLLYARAVPALVHWTLVLTCLATGAGIACEPPTELVSTAAMLRPTLLFISTRGAQLLEHRLWVPATGALLYPLFRRVNMNLLRNGLFPRGRLLDSWIMAPLRAAIGVSGVRAAVLAGSGTAADQTLLDALRLYLGVPVMHAYVPAQLSYGGHSALVTAPASTSNMYDLQAFAPESVDDESARSLAASVGPPSVALELKLVQHTPAVARFAKALEQLRTGGHAMDPLGEVYVRGYTLTARDYDATTISPWHATGDVALMRTNGTLVVVAPRGAAEAGMLPSTVSSMDMSERLAAPAARVARRGAAAVAAPALLLGCALACVHGAEARHMTPQRRGVSLVPRAESVPPLNTTMVSVALEGVLSSQRASWEQGVLQSAVTEYLYPEWTFFKKPGPELFPSKPQPTGLLRLAEKSVSSQDRSGRLASKITGDERIGEGATMDSASCGEGVLIGAWVTEGFPNHAPAPHSTFGTAAQRQLNYLLHNVTRTPTGALNQRASKARVQLWSDSAYMGPPFLAAYGVVTGNETLVRMAYEQLQLQRNALRIPRGPAAGLWRHIVQFNGRSKVPQPIDSRAWLTGLGWAAAGMLRVAAMISASPWAQAMHVPHDNLLQWTDELLGAVYQRVDGSTGLLPNNVNDTKSFRDAAGSALVTYAAFRLGSMDASRQKYVDDAERAYQTLAAGLTPASSFTNGLLTVNELNTNAPGPTSTESLSFMILMSAARRDYYAGNVTGAPGPPGPQPAPDTQDGATRPGAALPLVVAVMTATLMLVLVPL